MRRSILLILIFTLVIGGCGTAGNKMSLSSDMDRTDAQMTSDYFRKISKKPSPNIAELKLFFTKMPKGGDIHHHYSGSIYAETYLEWVRTNGQLIDKETLEIKNTPTKDTISVEQLEEDSHLYRRVLMKWSDLDFSNHFHEQISPDLQFFDTFGYFGPASDADYNKGLEILKWRALAENVQYLETMLTSVKYKKQDMGLDSETRAFSADRNDRELWRLLTQRAGQMERDTDFKSAVEDYIANYINQNHRGIDDDRFTMRFQTYAHRGSSPSKVFSGMYAGFAVADRSHLVVGVNIVGPENGLTALRDYWLHMMMFKFCREKFPDVSVSMHAGELTLGMVRPEDLKFHVHDAIFVAGADRIGHGVDIVFERNADETMAFMRENKKSVEINLTSNEFILGVMGDAHPVTVYHSRKVPLVISTDDSGVSRNNLTQEYVLLASRYDFTYDQIKEFVYNSIRYSFLEEPDKVTNLDRLDKAFARFEAEIAKR